ncbi:unnamed protein product [Caenorhabditis nigoni]
MAAIALVDIASSLYVIQLEAVDIFKSFSVCYSSSTYYKLLSVDVFLESVRTVTRRCSTWLSFSITLIRTLAIRYAMNPKFEILSKQKTAFFLITLVFAVFIPMQIFGPYRLEAPIGNYTCKPNVTRSTYTFFWYTRTEFYMPKQEFLAKTHKVVEGLLSRILPCILVPIATVFLIREIKKAEIQRKKMASSSNMKSSKNTSKLVLALTLTFFVAELPLGIVYVLKPSNYTVNAKNIGFTDIIVLQTFEEFFSVLLTITTATHMIICVFMSSQYRETALSVVRCGYVPKTQPQDVPSVSTIRNADSSNTEF